MRTMSLAAIVLAVVAWASGCDEGSTAAIEPSVTVADQTADPASVVLVAEVVSPGDGWLVILDDADGAFGQILGRSRVIEGTTANVEVELDRQVVNGETLYARLHRDVGEIGVFEDDKDTPVTDSTGRAIAPSFVVTVPLITDNLRVVAEDQTAEPTDTVVIKEAIAAGPAWVAVHADDGGEPGEVIGQVAIAKGNNTNVVVVLDRSVVHQETLHAVLHVDAGTLGLFESEVDVAATRPDGSTVADTFVVRLPIIVPRVNIGDQQVEPADEINVDDVDTPETAFVVIRADDGAGAPAGEIGTLKVEAGTHDDVALTLTRDIVHGEVLHAALHVDSNGNGAWDAGSDAIAVDEDGAEVRDTFTVNLRPSVTVTDQTADPASEVVVTRAVSLAGGFVVVTDSADAVIAAAPVAAGENLGVVVTLDRDIVDGETLTASVHGDDNDNGSFDPAADELEGEATADFVVYEVVEPALTAADTTLDDLTTRLPVTSVTSNGPGWLVVHQDDAASPGSPGMVIGHLAVVPGTTDAPVVELDRPLADQEVVHVMLHVDVGQVGVWEPKTDSAAMDGGGATVVQAITVTVPPELVDARFTITNDGSTSYDWKQQEPSNLAAIGEQSGDQTITLREGWRYEVFNEAAGAHPLALLDASDTHLLSQDSDGTLEVTDPDGIAWEDDGSAVRFTVTAAFVAQVVRYVCTVHAAMTGDFEYVAP